MEASKSHLIMTGAPCSSTGLIYSVFIKEKFKITLGSGYIKVVFEHSKLIFRIL